MKEYLSSMVYDLIFTKINGWIPMTLYVMCAVLKSSLFEFQSTWTLSSG